MLSDLLWSHPPAHSHPGTVIFIPIIIFIPILHFSLFFFFPSASWLFNLKFFSFSKSCLMVRTDELSHGVGGEILFPSLSVHRTWLLSTLCARSTKSGQPLPSSRKRRKLLSKTSLLVLKKVQVLCCTPYNINYSDLRGRPHLDATFLLEFSCGHGDLTLWAPAFKVLIYGDKTTLSPAVLWNIA